VPEKDAVPVEDPAPGGGAVVAIQSFGDFLGFNPHLHVLISDGCFYRNGMFRVAPRIDTKPLEEIFRYKVFNMLLSRGIITRDLVSMLLSWRHSGFSVFCGPRIQPGEEEAMENLARYIIRASFSQERMSYVPEEAKVVYRSKDGKEEKVFDALEWPRQKAAGCKHSRPCANMFRTKGSKWFDTMDITATSAWENGKSKTRMNGYPVFWNLKDQRKNTKRTGHD